MGSPATSNDDHLVTINRLMATIMEGQARMLWVCNIQDCGKTFSTRSAAYRHKKSVHECRRWVCPVCSKQYAQKDSLKRHRMARHPAPKDQCGDSTTPPTLKRARPSTPSSDVSSDEDEEAMSQDTGNISDIVDGLHHCNIGTSPIEGLYTSPPVSDSPLARGYIKAPLTIPYQPPSDWYYGDPVPLRLINREDNLPIPGRIKVHPQDAQGSPRSKTFVQAAHSYKTVSEALWKLEDHLLPKCALRGERGPLDNMD